jgi:cellobiose-specific phosphotransferase system component IIA
MSDGLMGVGENYKDKAMSGFIRMTADQQKINEANRELEHAHRQQTVQNVSTGAGIAVGLLLALL